MPWLKSNIHVRVKLPLVSGNDNNLSAIGHARSASPQVQFVPYGKITTTNLE
jgi:hypothetical protein